jgi:predicted DNA-binding ribbon-helix-helix protein
MREENDRRRAVYGGIVTHSLSIAGHRTSVSLDLFWDELKRIAIARGRPVASLIATIDAARGKTNLSSAIRVFVLNAARHGSQPAT